MEFCKKVEQCLSSHFYFANIFLTKYITAVSQNPWGICSRVTLWFPNPQNGSEGTYLLLSGRGTVPSQNEKTVNSKEQIFRNPLLFGVIYKCQIPSIPCCHIPYSTLQNNGMRY